MRASTPGAGRRGSGDCGRLATKTAVALLVLLFCRSAIAQTVQPTLPARTVSSPSPASGGTAGASVANPRAPNHSATSHQPEPAAPTGANALGAAEQSAVISYLGELISWYRHLQVEERLATEPAETLFVAENRRNANRIVQLGFQYADAAARIVEARNPGLMTAIPATTPVSSAAASAGLNNLLAHRAAAQSAISTAAANVQRFKEALGRARRRQRELIAHQLATAKAELALAQSHADVLNALVNFESGSSGATSDIQAQIEQLKAEVALPPGGENGHGAPAVAPVAAARAPVAASGMVGQAEGLFALRQKSQDLATLVLLTSHLRTEAEKLRTPLRDEVVHINQEISGLAAGSTSDNLATVQETEKRVAALGAEHKLSVAALLPLSMQTMALSQYGANLERWRAVVAQRSRADLYNLLLRLGGLLLLLIAIVAGAALWRRITFRYVHDLQRRHQLVQLSRLGVVALIALVLLFGFANELGALATVMGLAAAGVALTLQNVILSVAGFFFISGRYGIRLGDRVRISAITGEVIEIGLFKMTLMELGGDDAGYQPTGRVTVFPNSVVFQPSGSFSKQFPGSDFAWNELRLTLAPECDYRLAERRLADIVNEVFAHYRATLEREYRGLERDLHQPFEPLRPQSRLRLSEAGIELVIRYPVHFKRAARTADEIARRLVDALKREPALKLATPGTPMIQAAETVLAGEEAASPREEKQPSDASMGVAAGRVAPDAAAAAVGATAAAALIETTAAVQQEEGLAAPAAARGKP